MCSVKFTDYDLQARLVLNASSDVRLRGLHAPELQANALGSYLGF